MPAESDPDFAALQARRILEIYSEGTARMLDLVARRLAEGIEQPGWAEMKLAQMAILQRDARAVVDQLDNAATSEAAAVLTDSFEEGVKAGTAELSGSVANFGRVNEGAINALVRETITGLASTKGQILRSVLDGYRDVISETATFVNLGVSTRRQASQAALRSFAQKGITGFRDSAGRQWEIESYAEMTIRTASGRAAIAGHLDRIESSGNDLVIVSNHSEECKLCRPFEGKVLSISGRTTGRVGDKTVKCSVAEAQRDGFQHSNCRHNLSAFIPGLTKAPKVTSDPEGDKERQRHRALERRVRATKREEATQRAYVEQLRKDGNLDNESRLSLNKAIDRRKKATEALSTFIEANDRKRLRYRENPGGR